jgi:exonuclease VII small subunit
MEEQLSKNEETIEEGVACSENILRLRELVDKLENDDNSLDESEDTLSEIEKLIKSERSIIKKLKRSDSKLRHYEVICNSILTLISASNG